MNKVDLSITKKVIEIVFLIGLIIGTYFMWDNLNLESYAAYAANSQNLLSLQAYEKEPINDGLLLPVDDKTALNTIKPGIIAIENGINQEKSYDLVMRINQTSTLDYKMLTISIDDNIYKLNQVETIEDETYLYILIDSYEITQKNEHEIKLWLNKEATNEFQGKSLEYSFDVIEHSTQVAMN